MERFFTFIILLSTLLLGGCYMPQEFNDSVKDINNKCDKGENCYRIQKRIEETTTIVQAPNGTETKKVKNIYKYDEDGEIKHEHSTPQNVNDIIKKLD